MSTCSLLPEPSSLLLQPHSAMSLNLPESSASGTPIPAEDSGPNPVPDPVPQVPPVLSFSLQAAGNIFALLQSLITFSNAVAPVPAAQEPVPTRNVPLPPFVAAPSPFAGKSLHNQFPEIEAGTLLEIVHHDFKPDDLFKLSLCACDKSDPDHPESSKKMSGPYAAYPSLHSLLTPLTTYFSVLQSFATSSGDANAASSIGISGQHYIAHILDLHQHYDWLAVVEYHIHFHLCCWCEMADGNYNGWLQADPDLLNSFVYDRHRSACTEPSRGSTKKDVKDQVCFAYNKCWIIEIIM